MDLMERHHIKNIKGILMFKDIALFHIEVVNYNLIKLVEYSRQQNFKYYPYEFTVPLTNGLPLGYFHVDFFFKHRVVQDGAQDIRVYLNTMGLDYYDLDELIKRTNGHNFMNPLWFKFNNYGATQYSDLAEQSYPVLK